MMIAKWKKAVKIGILNSEMHPIFALPLQK